MKQVILRALEPTDIDAIYHWENDSSVWEQSMTHTPFSRHLLTQFLMDNSSNDIYATKQLRLMADDAESSIAVGCIDLYDFDPYHHRAGVGLLIDSRYRKQGYGQACLHALISFVHQHLQLHQLHCIIAANNRDSLHTFHQCGFLDRGLLPHWIHHSDGWIDAVVLSLIIEK